LEALCDLVLSPVHERVIFGAPEAGALRRVAATRDMAIIIAAVARTVK
jgi:hypothetical protein